MTINQLEDGRLLIVGTISGLTALDLGVKVDAGEEAIVISPDLLSDYVAQASAGATKTAETEYAELIGKLRHPPHNSSYSHDGGWTDSDLDAGEAVQAMHEAAIALSCLLAENARLKEMCGSARFALYPFTLEDEWGGEIPDLAKIMIGIRIEGQFDEFFPDRAGADITNVRRTMSALAALHGDPHLVQPQQSPEGTQ